MERGLAGAWGAPGFRATRAEADCLFARVVIEGDDPLARARAGRAAKLLAHAGPAAGAVVHALREGFDADRPPPHEGLADDGV